jgi:hypothetical protein
MMPFSIKSLVTASAIARVVTMSSSSGTGLPCRVLPFAPPI